MDHASRAITRFLSKALVAYARSPRPVFMLWIVAYTIYLSIAISLFFLTKNATLSHLLIQISGTIIPVPWLIVIFIVGTTISSGLDYFFKHFVQLYVGRIVKIIWLPRPDTQSEKRPRPFLVRAVASRSIQRQGLRGLILALGAACSIYFDPYWHTFQMHPGTALHSLDRITSRPVETTFPYDIHSEPVNLPVEYDTVTLAHGAAFSVFYDRPRSSFQIAPDAYSSGDSIPSESVELSFPYDINLVPIQYDIRAILTPEAAFSIYFDPSWYAFQTDPHTTSLSFDRITSGPIEPITTEPDELEFITVEPVETDAVSQLFIHLLTHPLTLILAILSAASIIDAVLIWTRVTKREYGTLGVEIKEIGRFVADTLRGGNGRGPDHFATAFPEIDATVDEVVGIQRVHP